jgi:sporulation protein YlmC with PRC-barrel domain
VAFDDGSMMNDGLVLLSRQLGRPVLTTTGSPLGRVADFTVRLDSPHPLVHRLLVRRDRRRTCLVSWATAVVSELDEGPVRVLVEGAAIEIRPEGLFPDELLLARDVLDTQVVDLRGHRFSRVSDVLLLRLPGGRLELAAVDVGFRALLRRIGPHRARSPRTASPVLGAAVDWDDLHLTSDRGHVTQLSTAEAGFRRLAPRELAELLARLSTPKATDLLRAVAPEHAAAAVLNSDPVTGGRLLDALPSAHAERLLAAAQRPYAEHLDALARAVSRPRRLLRTAGWRIRSPRPPAAGRRP